ncbi:MAG TPA: hypothetical protein VLX92_02380 [Kofleriaceae bacterium]|nr:hypothetical protein [Kofleriaceae bacterium]
MRLGLILLLATGYVAWHTRDAQAKKHDSDSDSDDDSGDDDSGSEDNGDDNGSDETDCDENCEDDKDQPPVTAGGLYTLQTYPVNEIVRPLTMTQHIKQVRVSLGTDISAKGAFGTGGLSVEGVYGLSDNFMLLGGFTNAYNMMAYNAYFGFEGALAYDLFDIRLAASVGRNAISEYQYFCSPVSSNDMVNQNSPDPSQCGDSANATIVNLPDGHYHAGDTQFSLNLGFPFRYAFKPEIAIVALQSLIKIDFNGVQRDHVLPNSVALVDASGNPVLDSMGNQVTVTQYVPVGNKATPDLVPSLGLAVNPIPQLSIVAYAQLIIPDFDTSAGAFQVPVTLRVEASPSQQFDIGLAFTLLNVDPPDPQSPIDNRFLSAYVQARW